MVAERVKPEKLKSSPHNEAELLLLKERSFRIERRDCSEVMKKGKKQPAASAAGWSHRWLIRKSANVSFVKYLFVEGSRIK